MGCSAGMEVKFSPLYAPCGYVWEWRYFSSLQHSCLNFCAFELEHSHNLSERVWLHFEEI